MKTVDGSRAFGDGRVEWHRGYKTHQDPRTAKSRYGLDHLQVLLNINQKAQEFLKCIDLLLHPPFFTGFVVYYGEIYKLFRLSCDTRDDSGAFHGRIGVWGVCKFDCQSIDVDKDPALTVDGSGRFWVAWHAYRPKEDRILVRSFKGQRRGPLLTVSEEVGINFQPRIVSGGDAVWVVWCAVREGRWCVLARSADEMGEVVRLGEADASMAFPDVTSDSEGRIWAVWTALVGRRRRVLGRCLDGDRWAEIVDLSQRAGDHYRPVLCGHAGGAWVAYQTLRNGACDLFLRNWTPDGVGQPRKFSLTDAWELFPRLCPDGSGGIWATWTVTRDVIHPKGFVDHKVEAMASHFDGRSWTPYRGPDRTMPEGYVAHLYDGLLGREHYMGFVGWRRRPQIVRETNGDVWVLYERKEDELVNRHGPDALFYARPLTGRNQGQFLRGRWCRYTPIR